MKIIITTSALMFLTLYLLGCSLSPQNVHLKSSNLSVQVKSIEQIAESYVKLVLQVGLYDDDVVDAYYGPKEWVPDESEKQAVFPFESLSNNANNLIQLLSEVDTSDFDSLQQMRFQMLQKKLRAIDTKIDMISGIQYSFDEEALRLYDAIPPKYELSYFDDLIAKLEEKVPGEGDLSERFSEYSKRFEIPADRLSDVFQVAIAESRKRTAQYIELPENENFVLEYVKDKPWGGYNYYQGNAQSLIQINTDFPTRISRVIDLAAHEGYPGHHVFSTLLEQNLTVGKGWVEYSVFPLFSPQALIAEGSANYGIDVAFPGEARIEYEKSVLFPLAGLNPADADLYYEILALTAKLSYARNEAARGYLNGELTREQAADIIQKYGLTTRERALNSTRFIDRYRSYVINYNLGKDLVADFMKRNNATAERPDVRWAVFEELIKNPNTASSISN